MFSSHVRPADFDRLASDELSFKAKIGHVLLLLASTGMLLLLIALLITEDGLPVRTRWSFAVLSGVAAAWIAYASWVLFHQRPLIARHRVIAAKMALGFSIAFVLVTGGAALLTGSLLLITASLTGLPLVALAFFLLVRARNNVAALQARRMALEEGLRGS